MGLDLYINRAKDPESDNSIHVFGISYGGFHNLRTELARASGIDLNRMVGFSEDAEPIEWETIKDDIKILLDHSDCDGTLSPEECARILTRLTLIKPKIDPQWLPTTERLLAALTKSVTMNMPLEFW